MRRMIFHPSVPKKLATAFRRAGSYSRLSAQIKVNTYYIHRLLKHGEEPTNPEIRARLYLPRRPRQPRTPKPEEFPGQKRITKIIRRLHRETTIAFKKWRPNHDDQKMDER